MDRIQAEGFDQRFARHSAMSQRIYDWAIAHGLPPFADESCRSKTVATINNPKNWIIGDLNKFLLQNGLRIANGYGKIKDVTFRIATMGETSIQDVEDLLSAMEDYLKL